ncbi:unnamed protein product [Albugo candida]|uniref:U6 snRNA-associated Sm-like protein LSm1 n=1 Tax=Albugo candida TaxID=65357 RepID=A0A024FUH1_9STRA|nr:unnamed protein product [Albugo candida]|eukprot:CCI10542.1 unnamed protein product [Albugo candida]
MTDLLARTISLFDQLDQQVLVVLRDGRHLIGYFRSFDQYSNILLEDTFERHICGRLFCDIALGLYIIRGDNVVLLGNLAVEKEDTQPFMRQVTMEEILEAENQLKKDQASVREEWNFDIK